MICRRRDQTTGKRAGRFTYSLSLSKKTQVQTEFPDPIGVGPVISLILTLIGEVICPVLILIGVKTRLAAIPALLTMLVAAFIVHASDPFQKKELAIIFALGFLVIMIGGTGKFAIDKK